MNNSRFEQGKQVRWKYRVPDVNLLCLEKVLTDRTVHSTIILSKK
ncbi:hypothetical protein [Muricoprocola aceti]|uniref:Uncharacterized protein n=1 Tax=Muricoprocola aceti TaxID=2981772 RepID=A0ABT2SLH0_9FIRM|nr:hypothetical protein [Muricoprocola aceti]MCU6725318.1 hypothetical protein [Muricoprocola aceti]